MRHPRIAVVAHRREVESVVGRHKAVVVTENYLAYLDGVGADRVILWPGMSRDPVDSFDGVLLIGGGDVAPGIFGSADTGEEIDAQRDSLEMRLVGACRARKISVLGVYRRVQILNVALGGTLRKVPGHRQELPLSEPAHHVEITEGSTLGELVGVEELQVNSYHVSAVDWPGADVQIVAQSSDGATEAVESTDAGWWCLGIQWHAELLEADHASLPCVGLVDAAQRST